VRFTGQQALHQLGFFDAGVLVHQPKQRRDWLAPGLTERACQQTLRDAVHVVQVAVCSGADDGLADRGKRDLSALALGVEGVLESPALRQEFAGAPHGKQDKQSGGREIGHHERRHDEAGSLTEAVGECFGERADLVIEPVDLCLPGADLCRRCRPFPKLLVHVTAEPVEREDHAVGGGPMADGDVEVAEAAEVLEQPDHPRQVIGVISALQESDASRIRVRFGLLKREPRRMIGQRNGDGCTILAEEFFLAGVGIKTEKIDGVFLALRPLAFAADIGANRRQGVEAAAGNQRLDENHDDERPDKPEKAGAVVCR